MWKKKDLPDMKNYGYLDEVQLVLSILYEIKGQPNNLHLKQ